MGKEKDTSSQVTTYLKAPDGGWGWIIVLCSFMIHFIIVGTNFSLSVLFVSWVEDFKTSRGLMSWVISIYAAVMFGIGPVPAALASRFGYRAVVISGGFIASIGLALGQMATNVYMLLICLGFITGTGCGFCYLPAVAIVAQYFDLKRSVALGIGAAGVGIGAFVLAPVVHLLMESYGWRGTLLIMSGFFLNLVVCGLLMRPLELESEEIVIDEAEELHGSKPLLIQSQNIGVIKEETNGVPRILLINEKDNGDVNHINVLHQKNGGLHGNEDTPLICDAETDTLNHTKQITHTENSEVPLSRLAMSNALNSKLHKEVSTRPSVPVAGGSLQHLNARNEEFVRKFSSQHSLPHRIHTGSRTNLSDNTHISQRDLLMSGSMHSLSVFKSNHFNYEGKDYSLNNGSDYTERNLFTTSSNDAHTRSASRQKSRSKTTLPTCLKSICPMFSGFLLLKDFPLLIFVISNTLTNLSYLMPVLFMVDRAVDIGIDKRSAALLVSINGVGNVFGRIFFGFLADRNFMDKIWMYILSLTACGLATCFSPVCGESVVLHGMFAFTFGCFMGAYVTLCPVVLVDLVGIKAVGQAYGVVLLFMGIAGLLGPPLAGGVFDWTGDYTVSFVLHGIFIVLSALVLIPVVYQRKRGSKEGQ